MARYLLAACAALMLSCNAHARSDEPFWPWLSARLTMTQIEHERVDHYEDRYRRRSVELEVMLEQGQDLLWPLAQAVSQRGFPIDLALLPIVESHLDASARSGVGAGGLWQLIPNTARHLGLTINPWLDERSDFDRATTAALDYLEYLHARFGSWPLALVAYNAGEGRVSQALARLREQGLPDDVWYLDMTEETTAYVPKLLALARVLRDPRGIKLPSVTRTRHFSAVDLGGPMDVHQISRLAGINVALVYELNPQFKRWATPPEGPYRAYLPSGSLDRARAAVTAFKPGDRARWRQYRVESGDTLGMLELRFDTDQVMIRRANGLRGVTIRAGQTLWIPQGAKRVHRRVLLAAAARTRVAHTPRLEVGWHRVESGDSLWTIARRYGVSVALIEQLNDLDSRRLVPGQILRVNDGSTDPTVYYTVQPGDVLSRIAVRFNVTVKDIRRWNGLPDSLLRPGDKLKLHPPAHASS